MSDHKPCPYPDGDDDGLLEYGLWQLEKAGLSSQNVSPEMLAKLESKQAPHLQRTPVELTQALIDPDIIGSSEYRAIYECIMDAVKDCDAAERFDVAKSMLKEFIEQAKSAKRRLKKMRKIEKASEPNGMD